MEYRIRLENKVTGEVLVSGKSWTLKNVAEYVLKTCFSNLAENCTAEIIESSRA